MAVTPIWPAGSNVNEQGEITFHGRTAESLLNEFGSPLYVIDTDDVRARAAKFVKSGNLSFSEHENESISFFTILNCIHVVHR